MNVFSRSRPLSRQISGERVIKTETPEPLKVVRYQRFGYSQISFTFGAHIHSDRLSYARAHSHPHTHTSLTASLSPHFNRRVYFVMALSGGIDAIQLLDEANSEWFHLASSKHHFANCNYNFPVLSTLWPIHSLSFRAAGPFGLSWPQPPERGAATKTGTEDERRETVTENYYPCHNMRW